MEKSSKANSSYSLAQIAVRCHHIAHYGDTWPSQTLTHRRLPGLYVNSQAPLDRLWKGQFQGSVVSLDQLAAIKAGSDRLDIQDNRLGVIYLDEALTTDDDWMPREAHRMLSQRGTLLLRQPFGHEISNGFRNLAEIKAQLEDCGFSGVSESIYRSSVVQYDWLPLLICRK